MYSVPHRLPGKFARPNGHFYYYLPAAAVVAAIIIITMPPSTTATTTTRTRTRWRMTCMAFLPYSRGIRRQGAPGIKLQSYTLSINLTGHYRLSSERHYSGAPRLHNEKEKKHKSAGTSASGIGPGGLGASSHKEIRRASLLSSRGSRESWTKMVGDLRLYYLYTYYI